MTTRDNERKQKNTHTQTDNVFFKTIFIDEKSSRKKEKKIRVHDGGRKLKYRLNVFLFVFIFSNFYLSRKFYIEMGIGLCRCGGIFLCVHVYVRYEYLIKQYQR